MYSIILQEVRQEKSIHLNVELGYAESLESASGSGLYPATVDTHSPTQE
jgi:hypothetical protein